MPLVLSSAATAACSPSLSSNYNESFHHNIDEDIISVASRSSAGAEGDWDSILCASPSSACAGTTTRMNSTKKIRFSTEVQVHHIPKNANAKPDTKLPALVRCYGNADFSDRIGRTLSFLLLARIAVSFLMASLLGEESTRIE